MAFPYWENNKILRPTLTPSSTPPAISTTANWWPPPPHFPISCTRLFHFHLFPYNFVHALTCFPEKLFPNLNFHLRSHQTFAHYTIHTSNYVNIKYLFLFHFPAVSFIIFFSLFCCLFCLSLSHTRTHTHTHSLYTDAQFSVEIESANCVEQFTYSSKSVCQPHTQFAMNHCLLGKNCVLTTPAWRNNNSNTTTNIRFFFCFVEIYRELLAA